MEELDFCIHDVFVVDQFVTEEFFEAWTAICFDIVDDNVVPMSLVNLLLSFVVHGVQVFHVIVILLKQIHDKVSDRLFGTLFARIVVGLLSQPWCLFVAVKLMNYVVSKTLMLRYVWFIVPGLLSHARWN